MSDEVIRREFPAVLEPTGDGRTLDIRIIPWNVEADVRDGRGPVYRERWLPGAFSKQENAANRVLVNVEHEQSFGGVVGRGVTLKDAEDGFHGEFRILAGPDGDKALELVSEGILTGVSVEAVPLKSERNEAGVVSRVKARLINIALCRFPAFPGAEVLAMREQPDDGEPEPDPAPEPEPIAALERSEADEILKRIGYEDLLNGAVVRKPWDNSASRFEDDEWHRSCLIDRGENFNTAKTRYALPVLEPNGDLNVDAMHSAAAVLAGGRGGVSASTQAKAAAARKLRRYYSQASEEPPPAVTALASRS